MERPGTQEPGASATARPLFPWKEPNRQVLEAEALVSPKDARIPGKKTAPAAPRNALPAPCAWLRSRPPDPAGLPDLSPPPQVAPQQRVPVPSQVLQPPSPTGIRGRQRSGAEAALPSAPHRPPARPRRRPLPGVNGARPASGAGDLAGGGGDRGRTAQGPGRSRPLCIRRGRGAGGRANGRPPGATPRGAIRPPRSGPGPARRALHFLGAF